MTRRACAVVVAVWVLGLSSSALAQVPRKINFQGRLADPTGTPKTGLFSMEFQIWTAATGGTMCHSEVQANLPVNGGLFSALIGSASGISASCTFTSQHFVAIKVGTELLNPRIPLLSAPFVFNAAKMISGSTTYVPGNGSGNIPLNNGTLNTGLSAASLDGHYPCELGLVAVYTCSGQPGVGTSCPSGSTWSFLAYMSIPASCSIFHPPPPIFR
jgi:hypothetical protein